MDDWIEGGVGWKGQLFIIPKGNNKTMDLSMNSGKQTQAYRILL